MKSLALLILILFSTNQVNAKPIDIPKISKKQGYATEIEAAAKSEGGEKQSTQIKLETVSQFMKGDNLQVGVVECQIDQERDKDTKEVDRTTLLHYRHRYFTSDKLGVESFIERSENTENNLELGYLYGTGPFYRFYHNFFLNLTTGIALVREFEQYQQDDNQVATRGYAYLSAGIRLPPKLLLGTTIHAEPKLDDKKDNRIFTKSFLKYKLQTNTTAGINIDTSYDTHPPEGIPSNQHAVEFTIGVRY